MEDFVLQVYKGVYDQSTEVAIKHLKYETQKDMDEALFEVAILKKQLHPNVLQFLGASIGVRPSPFALPSKSNVLLSHGCLLPCELYNTSFPRVTLRI